MWSALQHHIAPAIVVLEKHVDFDMDGFDLHILSLIGKMLPKPYVCWGPTISPLIKA